MNVDDFVGVARDKIFGQHLHVSGKYDEVYALLLEQVKRLLLLRVFVLWCDRKNVERDPEASCHRFKVRVVADDKRDLDVPLAGLTARQQVVQTVRQLRDKNRHARDVVGEVETPGHVEPVRHERLKEFADLLGRDSEAVQIPFDTHKERMRGGVYMFVQMDNVAAVLENEVSRRDDNSLLVGTVHQNNGGSDVRHMGPESTQRTT